MPELLQHLQTSRMGEGSGGEGVGVREWEMGEWIGREKTVKVKL